MNLKLGSAEKLLPLMHLTTLSKVSLTWVGGGTAVYELTRDTTTGCYTLGASYNDLVASGGGVAHLSMGSTGDAYLNIAAYAHKGNTYMAVAVSPDIGYEDEPITQLVLSASSADANFTNCSSPQPPTPEPN